MSLWRRIRPLSSTTFRFLRIASIEARNQHSGARLGLLWTPLSAIIFSALLGLIFRHSDTVPAAVFFLYVYCGYVFWIFVSDSLTGSTNLIQTQLDFSVHNNLSVLGLFGKALVDRLFKYFLNVGALLLMILVLSPWAFSPTLALFPLFLALALLTSIGVSYLINIVTILYPDMRTAVQVGARIMFFASPVFWSAEASHGARKLLVTYNPVAYYLSVCRQVFGLQPFEPFAWGVMAGFSIAIAGLGYLALAASQNFVRNFK